MGCHPEPFGLAQDKLREGSGGGGPDPSPDSSEAEFILSDAEGLPQKDISHFVRSSKSIQSVPVKSLGVARTIAQFNMCI